MWDHGWGAKVTPLCSVSLGQVTPAPGGRGWDQVVLKEKGDQCSNFARDPTLPSHWGLCGGSGDSPKGPKA